MNLAKPLSLAAIAFSLGWYVPENTVEVFIPCEGRHIYMEQGRYECQLMGNKVNYYCDDLAPVPDDDRTQPDYLCRDGNVLYKFIQL